MNNHDDARVERSIAALDAEQRAALLDRHVGPVLSGREPNEAGDLDYLRAIIAGQLKENDAKEASGFATLEARIAKLERKPGIAKAELDAILKGIAETVGQHIAKCFAELRADCTMRFKGVWAADAEYLRGDTVSHDGSLWVAVDRTKGGTPGKSCDWKLAAKRGSAP